MAQDLPAATTAPYRALTLAAAPDSTGDPFLTMAVGLVNALRMGKPKSLQKPENHAQQPPAVQRNLPPVPLPTRYPGGPSVAFSAGTS